MAKKKKRAKKKQVQNRNQGQQTPQTRKTPQTAGTEKRKEPELFPLGGAPAGPAEPQRKGKNGNPPEAAGKPKGEKPREPEIFPLMGRAPEPQDKKPQEEKPQEASFSWKRAGKIAAAGAAGLLAVVYIGGMVYLRDKFQPNTVINGIDVSLDTVEEAENKIANLVEKYRITLVERGGSKETITAEQLGYRYVSKGEAQDFQRSQKLYLWPVSLWQDSIFHFMSGTSFEEDLLEKTVDGLRCFDKKVETAPRNAYLKFNGEIYEMIKETQGKKVRKKKMIKALSQAVKEGQVQLNLEEAGCYFKPKITEKNRLLNKKMRNLNAYARTRIVYKFGTEQELLDGRTICQWLTCDDQGNVTLEEEKVVQYVGKLAEKYDTGGKPREFVTHGGSTVQVKGGSYGWVIDQETEAAELTEWIRRGTRRTRVPVYAKTAVSRENSDLGDSYVEVDLSGQHLWMYVDGEEIVSTDVVSGTYTNPSRCTPSGTYTLYYKKSPAVLRSNAPGDSYESPVSYWMPFNGGIGLHDANWRGSFGGSIYKYSGSHGCINLPTGAAREIYQNIYAGMPIICYY